MGDAKVRQPLLGQLQQLPILPAGGGPAPIDGVASLRVLETVFAAYAAAESGRSVRLGTR